ncbi:MAG: hypothetical protein ACOCVM_02770 [Desulfovibrionaceae bacterium]
MNDFLEKNWPALIIAAVIIIAMAMAGMISSSNLPGKGLQFKKVDKMPVAAMDGQPGPSLTLSVDGKPLEDPYLTTLVLRNTGNIPIIKDDYDAPVGIEIQNDATIVQSRFQLHPEDMNTKVSHSDKALTITPSLMNPGDLVVIQVLTEGGEPEFEIEGRIEGISKIYTEEGWGQRRWSQDIGLGYFVFILTLFNVMLFAIILKASHNARYVFIRRPAGIILFIAMCAVSLYTYFDLIEEHAQAIYRSSLLLLGCSIITLLLAWLVLRFTEREE